MKPSEIVEKFAKLTIFTHGPNEWIFVDLYNQLWSIKYTGSRTALFEITLIQEDSINSELDQPK